MFPLHPNHEKESRRVQLNSLPSNTAFQVTHQIQTPSVVPNMIQPTDFMFIGNSENPHESQENWMRIKRMRGLDGASLALGNGSSSSQFRMHGVSNVMKPMGSTTSFGPGHGGGYYIDHPYVPCYIASGFGVGNANEVSAMKLAVEKAYPYHHFLNTGFSDGNGNGMSVQKTAGVDAVETTASEKVRRRMIKNRESAARSRARRQAIIAQQQLEVTMLKKENELLRRNIEVLWATGRTDCKKIPRLSRALSSPI